MIPPQAAYDTCLRCHVDLGKDKTAPCPRCGADPVVERQIYAQLTPAIRDLRRIFFGGALLFAALTWLIDASLARAGVDTTRFLLVSTVEIAAFVLLGALAHVAPLATALVSSDQVLASLLHDADPANLFTRNRDPRAAARRRARVRQHHVEGAAGCHARRRRCATSEHRCAAGWRRRRSWLRAEHALV
jgi:hypothetical protein